MCDTMVALPAVTCDGSLLFAKNSDREPNEPHIIVHIPRSAYGSGKKIKCTYMEIDQSAATYEALLFKPHWIWGAEMGINEKGLVVGNEAVFTKEKFDENALLGMDILRLALERCTTAKDGLELIIKLIERYGQGGKAGYTKNLKYHNSYILADFKGAYVLETAGRHWVYKKVNDIYSISNALSIRNGFDGFSEKLVGNAISKGWCKSSKNFDFKASYENKLMTGFAQGNARQEATSKFMTERLGTLSVKDMMRLTRHHGGQHGVEQFHAGSMKSICMHAGGFISSQTTGSMVVRLKDGNINIWATGSSLPCISLYKPLWFAENAALYYGEEQQNTAVEHWRHIEAFHRMALAGRLKNIAEFTAKRDAVESELFIMAKTANTDEEKAGVMKYAYEQENKLIQEAANQAGSKLADSGRGSLYYRRYWHKQNKKLI